MGSLCCRLLLLLLCVVAGAPIAARPLHTLQMELWTADRGLAHNTVLILAQTAEGYLWVGTWEGLQRFDGNRFQTPEDAPVGVTNAGILGLAVAADGSLWVGTNRGGLFQLRGGVWHTHVPPDTPTLDRIAVLLPDPDGALWIGTASGRLLRWRDGQLQMVPVDGGTPGSIDGLAVSREGRRLAISNVGVLAIEGDRAALLPLEWPNGPPVLMRVTARRDGGFWLASSQGLLVLEAEPWRIRPGDYTQPIGRVLETNGGDLWLSADPQQLTRLRDGKLESLGRADGLPSDRIGTLLEDHEGNVWVGTNAGLLRLRETPFIGITPAHGLVDRYVRSLLELDDGRVIVASAGGLNLIEDGQAVARPAYWPAELLTRSTLALAMTVDGRLLVGTSGDGAWELAPGQQRRRRAPAEIAADHVRAFAADPDGRVWFGSLRGLTSCLGDVCRHHGPAEGLSGSAIMAVEHDRDGRLWVSSPQGVSVRDGDRFRELAFADGIRRTAFAFLSDRRGRRWMATENGLGLLVDGRILVLSTGQGLIDEALFSLLEDEHGQLWTSSNRGIQRFDPDEAEAVLRGQRTRIGSRIFRRADGLPATQANGASQPAAIRTADGRLWFATAGGIAIVDPAEVRTEQPLPPPRVALDAVLIDGVAQPAADTVVLAPNRQRLQFRYSGISFVAPERLQLRYRLSGFDAGWQTAGGERLASYTNLAPGRYHFEIQAGWGDDPEAGGSLRVAVEVPPAWHQQLAARIGLALLCGLAILGGMRLRLRGLRRQALRLQQQVERKTADLQAERDALARANARNADLLEQLGRQAREDSLTGLANRREADRRLADLLATGTPALVLIDLDHFKQINDELGHAVGDLALQTLANALRELQPEPALAARIGGEEFLLAYQALDPAAVDVVLASLRSRLLDPHRTAGSGVPPLRFSAGITRVRFGESVGAALKRADAALYAAKAGGRDRSHIAP